MRIDVTAKTLHTNEGLDRKAQNFGIKDMAPIMHMLTNMYSKPKQTLTQEYLCNARDAMREAANGKRIVVTVPTAFNPVLKIRDYGVGLSPDRVKEVFLYYGQSTKQGSNEQTGGFGIGGKSAWAYTDSFIIKSYFEGMERIYAAINAENNPTLNLLSEERSDEETGTCVEITVLRKDITDFKEAVLRCIHYWKPEEMPEIKGLREEELIERKKGDRYGNFELIDGWGYSLIVDGIPYPLNHRQLDSKNIFFNAHVEGALYLNTGDVTIAPSREEIIYDSKSIAKINSELNESAKAFRKYVADTKATLKNGREAIELHLKTKDILGGSFEWRYVKMNWGQLHIDGKEISDYVFMYVKDRDGNPRRKPIGRRTVYAKHVPKLLHVDTKESNQLLNRRARSYFLENPNASELLVLGEGTPAKFIKDFLIEGISKYAPTELAPRSGGGRTSAAKDKGEITVWRGNSLNIQPTALLARHDVIVYAPLELRETSEFIDTRNRFPNVYAVSKQVAKLLSGYKNCIAYKDWLASRTLSDDTKWYLVKKDVWNSARYDRLKTDKKFTYSSDKLNELVSIVKDTNYTGEELKTFTASEEFKVMKKEITDTVQSVYEQCPMLKHLDGDIRNYKGENLTEIVNYVNTNYKGK